MKTTVETTDSLLREAKRAAAERSTTLRQLIEEGLPTVLEGPKKKKRFKLKDGSFGSGGMLRDFTWEELMDEIYKGRGT